MKVYLDLDGVLCDFVSGCCTLHNKNLDAWPKNTYLVHDALGLTPEDFWRDIGSDFWANLPKTKDADDILNLCLKFVKNDSSKITLLTGLPSLVDGVTEHDYNAAVGKCKWINAQYPGFAFGLTNCKESFAHSLSVLIDDSDSNVRKFRCAQGEGILVPRPWNSLNKENTLKWLERSLGSIINP